MTHPSLEEISAFREDLAIRFGHEMAEILVERCLDQSPPFLYNPLNESRPDLWLATAFVWSATPEGSEFWDSFSHALTTCGSWSPEAA